VRRVFRRRRLDAPPPRIWPWLLAFLLLVCVAIGAAYALTREDDDDGGSTAPTSRVPSVVGLRAEQASSRLVADGFRAQLARAVSERARGIVVRQRPTAGTSLERGRTVTLVVSQGPATARVPDVLGLPLAQAFRRVEAAGLRPQAKRVFSQRAKGRVFRQRPAAGTELEREQIVRLTVSRGRGRVAVPDLIGLSESEAVRSLESAGLDASAVRVPSSEPAGRVVAQNPAAATRIARGSRVRLNVSRGSRTTTTPERTTTRPAPTATRTTPPPPPPTQTGTASSVATVPDVVGLDAPTAERRLRQAGFAVRSVTRDTSDPAEDGIVLEQQPPGGASARAGAQVTITLGRLVP
jgi:beta-lactam-binding protein with PASTA domain